MRLLHLRKSDIVPVTTKKYYDNHEVDNNWEMQFILGGIIIYSYTLIIISKSMAVSRGGQPQPNIGPRAVHSGFGQCGSVPLGHCRIQGEILLHEYPHVNHNDHTISDSITHFQ